MKNTRRKRDLGRAVAVAGLVIAPVAATTSASALGFAPTQASGGQSAASIIGLRVENARGDKLGEINSLVLNSSGTISAAIIGVGSFLDGGDKNVAIPYADVEFSQRNGRRVAVLDATRETLTNAPSYVWTENQRQRKPAIAPLA